jgi:iron transport multicopper oxidase
MISGPIIVKDSKAPFAKDIDGDFTVTLSDWYRSQAPPLINFFSSSANEDAGGSEPIPDSTLLQESGLKDAKFSVQPGKTYLVRVINMGSFVGQYFSIDGHDMTIVEVDGVYTEPTVAKQIYLTVAQRYAVLIKTKANKNQNYAVIGAMDSAMFDHVPPNVDVNSGGFLIYDSAKALPTITPFSTFDALDDMKIVPKDRQPALVVDKQIKMDFVFQNYSNSNRAFINGVTYVPQKVPTLYTALSAGKDATNPKVYGVNSNPFVLEYGKVYEIVLNNYDGGAHPWQYVPLDLQSRIIISCLSY